VNDNAPIGNLNNFPEWLRRNAQILYGFFGWYVINGLIWLILVNVNMDSSGGGPPAYVILNLLIFPANLLALILLAAGKRTRKMGLGILAALALNLLLSLLFGMLINGVCFIPFYIVWIT